MNSESATHTTLLSALYAVSGKNREPAHGSKPVGRLILTVAQEDLPQGFKEGARSSAQNMNSQTQTNDWNSESIGSFSRSFDGECLTPSAPQYSDACRVFNAMVNRKPALILRCRSAHAVAQAVRFAKERAAHVSIKSGGHNLAGIALNDGGITIDISSLRGVTPDLQTQTVLAQGGSRLGDIDRSTSRVGMAVPLGTVSDTGVGGLALGGGIGWLLPRYGLTCDNIEQIELVTSDGNVVIADEGNNPDLFWALRGGGGGNYGVVTNFRFKLHPVSTVYAGSIVYSMKHLEHVLNILREINSDQELSLCGMINFLFDKDRGDCISLDLCSIEPESDAKRIETDYLTRATYFCHTLSRIPFVEFQRSFDGCALYGFRRYAKSLFVDELSQDLASELAARFLARPSKASTLFIEELHGKFHRSNHHTGAFANRSARYNIHIQGCWRHQNEDELNLEWLRASIAAIQKHASPNGSYINYNSDLSESRSTVFSSSVSSRLYKVKKQYDPENFFLGTLNGIYGK